MTGKSVYEKYIAHNVQNWQKRRNTVDMPERKHAEPFLTISREYGCLAHSVAEKLLERIDGDSRWVIYDRTLVDKIIDDLGLSGSLAATLTDGARGAMTNFFQTTFSRFPSDLSVYRKLVETVRMLALNGNAVIIGRVANMMTRDFKTGYHVRLVAPIESRVDNLCALYGITRREAQQKIQAGMEGREDYVIKHLKIDTADPSGYDLVINTASMTPQMTADYIAAAMKIKGLL